MVNLAEIKLILGIIHVKLILTQRVKYPQLPTEGIQELYLCNGLHSEVKNKKEKKKHFMEF